MVQKPLCHHHAPTGPTATWPCPARAAFPALTLAPAFPVNNVPAVVGDGEGTLLLVVLAIPAVNMPRAGPA